jgi:RNA polymerase sigma-70 factor (ECF subfamily)
MSMYSSISPPHSSFTNAAIRDLIVFIRISSRSLGISFAFAARRPIAAEQVSAKHAPTSPGGQLFSRYPDLTQQSERFLYRHPITARYRRYAQNPVFQQFASPPVYRASQGRMKLSRDDFDRMAMEQLDMLYRIARRLTKGGVGAEDLVQETYMRAIRGWQGFHLNTYGIRPWLIRIMHNLHFSQSQRESRQPQGVESEQLEASGVHSHAGSTMPPIQPLSFESMDQRLVKALDQLPDEYRLVLCLWAVEDLSYKEIAAAMDIPIGTVMSRLHRARQKLGEQLRDFARQERVIRE